MFIGAILSVPAIPTAHAASVIVNNEKLTVQAPTLVVPPATTAPSGISYKSTGASTSSLTVYTEGFLFCANVPVNAGGNSITIFPAHESLNGGSAHLWALPSAIDVMSIGYRGSVLSVNRDSSGVQPSTLVCHGVGVGGEVASGLAEGIFDHPFDSATTVNYNHLVNWVAPAGFDWTVASNWASVPVDPCSSNANQPAQVAEDVACVAATGVRAGTGSVATRAATMWTATDGSSFTYVFRFDARYGPESPGIGAGLQLPTADELNGVEGAASVNFVVRDAFDSTYLGATGGHYCLLTALPPAGALNSSVCSGATSWPLNDGPLKFDIQAGEPPAGVPTKSFYFAMTRPIVGPPPALGTPVVGAAVFVERVVGDLGGDKFSGDDVVFGFMPASTGFPWMSGQ